MVLKENLRDFVRDSLEDSRVQMRQLFSRLLGVEEEEEEIPDEIQSRINRADSPAQVEVDIDALELFAYRHSIREYNPDIKHLSMIIDKSKEKGINPALVIAIITKESSFRQNAQRRNRDGSNDYGYFQLNSRWHNQHRNNIESHIQTGIDHIDWCLITERRNERRALSRYNSGRPDTPWGLQYADRVLQRKRRILNDVRQIQVVQQSMLKNLV